MNDVQEKRPRRLTLREEQRGKLIGCAEAAIVSHGVSGLRARDIAACAGCSVGAIYNHVADLDELMLLVGQRTMARLDAALAAAEGQGGGGANALGGQLLAWARAYASFAATHRELWRALFEFRMATQRDFPDWFATDQVKLFARLEAGLAPLLPHLAPDALSARARALFAAMHGIVALGIEGKLVALPPESIDTELVAFVETYVAGLTRG